MIASTLNYILLECATAGRPVQGIWTSILMLGVLFIIPAVVLLMIFLIKLMNRKMK